MNCCSPRHTIAGSSRPCPRPPGSPCQSLCPPARRAPSDCPPPLQAQAGDHSSPGPNNDHHHHIYHHDHHLTSVPAGVEVGEVEDCNIRPTILPAGKLSSWQLMREMLSGKSGSIPEKRFKLDQEVLVKANQCFKILILLLLT